VAAHRTHFVDKSLLYLFSTNIEFAINMEQIGIVPGGVRVNVSCVQDTARVYNILRERTVGVPAYATLTGRTTWGEDASFFGEDDVACGDVRSIIRTDDGGIIYVNYQGQLPMDMGSFRAICSGADQVGTAEEPAEFRLVVTPRYETDAPKYRWLVDHQCIGFGRSHMVRGLFRRVSYDVYALT
jgi:hypothetical protein